MGTQVIGPTVTDQGNAGYQVTIVAAIIEERQPKTLVVAPQELFLIEDEEAGDTHVAIYVSVRSDFPGTNGDIFSWNAGGQKINERAEPFDLRFGGSLSEVDITLFGPASIEVQGYADDDNDFPSPAQHENDLGSASTRTLIDPANEATLGGLLLGPTRTDKSRQGFRVSLTVSTPTVSPPAIKVFSEDRPVGNVQELSIFEDDLSDGSFSISYRVVASSVTAPLAIAWNAQGIVSRPNEAETEITFQGLRPFTTTRSVSVQVRDANNITLNRLFSVVFHIKKQQPPDKL
jgi:hypothetical protein